MGGSILTDEKKEKEHKKYLAKKIKKESETYFKVYWNYKRCYWKNFPFDKLNKITYIHRPGRVKDEDKDEDEDEDEDEDVAPSAITGKLETKPFNLGTPDRSGESYVYKINNYPGAIEPVYATLLIHKNQIIGGDITDTTPGGRVQGFAPAAAPQN